MSIHRRYDAFLDKEGHKILNTITKYSKAIAAVVSVGVSLLAVRYSGIDGPALESAIILILTTMGVIAAPKNTE